MKVLIIDQCSGSKSYPDPSPVFDSDDIDSAEVSDVINRDGVAAKKAKNLYSGRQQAFIDEATNLLRQNGVNVDRFYISAGFGLIDESTILPPYEVTFSKMSKERIRDRSEKLGIQRNLLNLLSSHEYDIVFLPLGKDYYTAIDVPELVRETGEDTWFALFNYADIDWDNLISLDARTDQAREFGVIVVELKGKLIKNFAERIDEGHPVRGIEDIREHCMYNAQGSLGSY